MRVCACREAVDKITGDSVNGEGHGMQLASDKVVGRMLGDSPRGMKPPNLWTADSTV